MNLESKIGYDSSIILLPLKLKSFLTVYIISTMSPSSKFGSL